jgi:nucleoside-diphosphate-sugar epimerase
MAKLRYLILGGAGYFGARLAQALRTDSTVTVTARRASDVRTKWSLTHGIELVPYDSSDPARFDFEGEFDAIINLAMPGAAEAGANPEVAQTRGLATAQQCQRWLQEGRTGRLVHFSTFHVYGAGGRENYNEVDVPAPMHPYGQAHLACEQLLSDESRAYVVRPSNMVGCPAHADLGDQAKLLFLDLCRQTVSGELRMGNDGLSYRDFIPFEDAIQAVKRLLKVEHTAHRLFNLAQGMATRLDEAARLIQNSAAPKAVRISLGNGSDAFRTPFYVNTTRLQELGWKAQASLHDEARNTIRFFT